VGVGFFFVPHPPPPPPPPKIAIPGLQRLALAHNQLKCEIPEDVDEMMDLLELDLGYNQFESLPADILDRPKDRGCDIVLDGLPAACDLAGLMEREPYHLSERYSMGYAEMIGKRPTMEDAFSIVGDFGEDMEFWGMYDGHAGRNAASYAADKHPPLLKKLLEEGDAAASAEGVLKAIDTSYFQVNAALKEELSGGDPTLKHAGSTAVVVLRIGNKLYVSNAGDSRAVLCRGGKALRISHDHKPTDHDEEDRIREQGGYVMVDAPGGSGRVNGGLAVSRSIGDFYMHPYVTEKPYLLEVELTDEDDFLILACDGVWDEVWDEDAVECVRGVDDPTRASAKLRDLAYVLGSDDNISVIVIQLNKEPVAH
jgi:serine/threonine protein phosphatase PrpC